MSHQGVEGTSSMNSKLTGEGEDEDVPKKALRFSVKNNNLKRLKTKVVQHAESE